MWPFYGLTREQDARLKRVESMMLHQAVTVRHMAGLVDAMAAGNVVDPAKVNELRERLRKSSEALATAVAANNFSPGPL